KVKAIAIGGPDFVQELIYSGRVGDTIKFLYREFGSGYIRAAYSQEAQYDLSISNIIKFKDAEIEVIEATNSKLVYRVITHFTDLM
ncbi:unnamed protein product, partial [Laminaria digitata]